MTQSTQNNADQFKQSFREEAREIVVDLEAALLELNEHHADMDLVGRVFRALHTLKGSGAMFGFEKLAAFTHNLETAFDQVRNGKLEIGSELIDLTLAALDQIRLLVEENPEAPADCTACESILSGVRRLAGLPDVAGLVKPAEPNPATASSLPSSPAPIASQNSPAGNASSEVSEWHIRFTPGPEFMLNGANPLLLVRELRLLGGLSVLASMAELPPLAELDPERCYVSWQMVLNTTADRDAIRDIFIFVEDSCALAITPATAKSSDTAGDPIGDRTARALAEPRAALPGRRSYDKADNASSLRIPAQKLDQFVDLVGELVTVQARLSELAARRDDPEVSAVSEEVERLASALRENSMNIRMLPIRPTFEKFRRLVHDLARDLGKDVDLTMDGADTELDKTVIDQLGDPLMHLIRNSMDHGIEPPEARAALGKRPTASIHLSARHSGASVLISVSDDGAGINTDAVRRRAIEKGLIPAEAALTEKETFALIFEPGFSTAQTITDVSGRGVGMDVVRQRVDGLRGSIDVASTPGRGTEVTLRLPLTLAIIDGLLVQVDASYFVLPLANTLECIELTRRQVESAHGKHLANVRGELIPYIRLRQYFHIGGTPPPIEQIMVVETAEGRYGFVVDQVLGNCQTVIKNLGRFYRHVQVVSGATILGNGSVALILDPDRLTHGAVHDALNGPARGSNRGPDRAIARCSRGRPPTAPNAQKQNSPPAVFG
jgi:two-component system chemotaxis sensor kinase CheA